MIWISVRPGVRGRMPRGTNVRRLVPGSLLASPDFWPFPSQLAAPPYDHHLPLPRVKSGCRAEQARPPNGITFKKFRSKPLEET